AGHAECECKEKASRFIGRVFPIDSKENAEEILKQIRKKEHSATHHCFAWVTRDSFRYSDDGEPNGSAGKPIYDQLCGAELVNALVVVTRYYGGTKLGVGGLVRAYASATKTALEKAGSVECFDYQRFTLQAKISQYQRLLALVEQTETQIEETVFSDIVTATVRIRESRVALFSKELSEITRGKSELRELL
ncbi:YigZ family protein, partial [Gemmatimonas aurantiaca]|nr:YigZ family protein [Gemmatimonas aurantiaca]